MTFPFNTIYAIITPIKCNTLISSLHFLEETHQNKKQLIRRKVAFLTSYFKKYYFISIVSFLTASPYKTHDTASSAPSSQSATHNSAKSPGSFAISRCVHSSPPVSSPNRPTTASFSRSSRLSRLQ